MFYIFAIDYTCRHAARLKSARVFLAGVFPCVIILSWAGVVILYRGPVQTLLKRGHLQVHPSQKLLLLHAPCSKLEVFCLLTSPYVVALLVAAHAHSAALGENRAQLLDPHLLIVL